MHTRRDFLRACGALAGGGLVNGLGLSGCGGSIVYEVTVLPPDDGASVFQATARRYEVRVARRAWQDPGLRGLAMVTAIDGFEADWIFEVGGRRHDASFDAAERTRVRTGEVITWREV